MGVNFYTLLGQMGTFAVLVWFTMKYVWPPITTAMAERQQKIAEGLAAAERAEHDAEQAQNERDAALREARAKAADIIANANKRGDDIIADKQAQAKVEADRVLEQARAQIEQETASAREHLRSQVGTLAVAGASRILGQEIDRDKHAALLDDFAKQI